MNTNLFITCLNFKLRDELRAEICAAAEKLFTLELFVANVRLTLEGDYDRQSQITYKASMLLELRSSEIIVCGQADLLMPAIKSVIDQAEHQLLARYAASQPVRTAAA